MSLDVKLTTKSTARDEKKRDDRERIRRERERMKMEEKGGEM